MSKHRKENTSGAQVASEVVEEIKEVHKEPEEVKEKAPEIKKVETPKKVSPASLTIKKECQICMPNIVGRPTRIDFRVGSIVTQKNVIDYILRNYPDIFEV